MHKWFLPDSYKHDLYLRVSSLSQGHMTVEGYIREFEQLQIRSGLEEESEQTMVRFLRSQTMVSLKFGSPVGPIVVT